MQLEVIELYQDSINLIVAAGACSILPAVICGIVERAYNALYSMISGERSIKL